jgi:hypothetical protein
VSIPTPPAKQLVLSLLVKDLRVNVPQWVGLVVLAVALPTGVWMSLGDFRTPSPAGPIPAPVPQVPLLSSTPTPLAALSMALPGALPPPGPNQIRAGKCDKRAAQVEISGGCWVKTETPPPCPEGIQWEHKGRCWLPVAEAKPVPTTGEPTPQPVAAPPE